MNYKFVDLDQPPQDVFAFASKYGDIVLDEIDGVETLSVLGRGNAVRSFSVISNPESEEDFLLSSKYACPTLKVNYRLTAKDDYHMRKLVDKLNKTFSRDKQRLRFYDEAYYYVASLASLEFNELSNCVIATAEFKTFTPYKYKDIINDGQVFRYESTMPAIPDEVVCTVLPGEAEVTSFYFKNEDSEQKMVFTHKVKGGDVIVWQPCDYFGLTLNGENVMRDVVPSAEFERFELRFLDRIVCPLKVDMRIKATLRELG